MNCYKIIITGIVQGVGFRPFIYNLAQEQNIRGWVGNRDSDVIIEISANSAQLKDFIEKIKETAPVLSKIESIKFEPISFMEFKDFSIRESQTNAKGPIFISPDVCTCNDCVRELKDIHDRRYNYPFINCTNCGPRFTIIQDIPYDRDKTTMKSFEMCDRCRLEYTNPSDRRYHAQPVSCHDCGPRLSIANDEGKEISDSSTGSDECIEYITKIIKGGGIAAIKGIGGYHLACNALDASAVDRLRRRKHRDDKPFAVMMKDIYTISKYCKLNDKEIQLLSSPASPIVLLEKVMADVLPEAVARLNRYLGVMLPYTPIHHILFEQADFPEVLVMTSGNLSSEPIFYKDGEAVNGLVGIADGFLTNNREIYIRTDDSVTRVFKDKECISRRSRGYVPKPIKIDVNKLLQIESDHEVPSVLASGGELKNVFCMNRDNLFYLSHHIGDLENENTNIAFRDGIEHFKKLFDIKPEYVAYDLHPGYYSSQYAQELENMKKFGVQHHKAHIASCMAENQLSGGVIGVAFDGTGYGEDGKIWGGEFFKGGYYGFVRAGHLEYIMMPGSDSAVKHPWRMALGYLYASGMHNLIQSSEEECQPLLNNISRSDIDFTVKMLDRKLNCPHTSSMGRFFDAVSALLGIKTDISYEGQAAIELEYYASEKDMEPYPVDLLNTESGFIINTSEIIKEIIREIKENKSKEHISSKFHTTIAEIVLQGCIKIRKQSALDKVVLSGGVFQNTTLLSLSVDRLKHNGFNVFTHSEIPANDGGIALGQAMMALAEILGK